jgi:hypothetical protein
LQPSATGRIELSARLLMTGSPVSDLLPFGWEEVNLTGDYVLDTQTQLAGKRRQTERDGS